jgi:uncharacterized protein
MSHLVFSDVQLKVSRDSDDDKFIECALSSSADFIVSGDDYLLVLEEYEAIKIVRTQNILEILGENGVVGI